MAEPPFEPVYLGDAVWASFDGYQIWLHTEDGTGQPRIALEPEVWDALVAYKARIDKVKWMLEDANAGPPDPTASGAPEA